MKNDLRTLIFAVVFGCICALVLTAACQLAKPYKDANEKAEEMRNYLTALGIPFEANAPAADLIDIFNRNVRLATNNNVVVGAYVPEGTSDPIAYAFPIQGMGLWGPVKGVLATEADLLTIRGLRFYQQEETPGLGGEIGAAWFVDQFKGKKLADASGTPGFRLLKKGSDLDENSVNAITGATMTSDRIQAILKTGADTAAAERNTRP